MTRVICVTPVALCATDGGGTRLLRGWRNPTGELYPVLLPLPLCLAKSVIIFLFLVSAPL
jgi:hypothetical protein